MIVTVADDADAITLLERVVQNPFKGAPRRMDFDGAFHAPVVRIFQICVAPADMRDLLESICRIGKLTYRSPEDVKAALDTYLKAIAAARGNAICVPTMTTSPAWREIAPVMIL